MAHNKRIKTVLAISVATAAIAMINLFNQGSAPAEPADQSDAQTGPEPVITEVSSYEEFWEKNKYTPLKKAESVTYRAELATRFANNSPDSNPTVGDLCAAHSLAQLQEKLAEVYPDKETISTEESFYLTTQIMMLCATGQRPQIN